MDWLSIFKSKVKNSILGSTHIDHKTWIQIWTEVKNKELIPQSPWFELEMGADKDGKFFQKLHWGLKRELGKVTLEIKKNESIHLYKKNNEICSVSISGNKDEFGKMWNDILIASFTFQKSKMEELLSANRLGLIDEKKMSEEDSLIKWMQATHKILKGAIEQARATYGQFVTARVLMGTVPMTKEFSIQIHCFNIEEVLMNTSTRQWKILAFDHGKSEGQAAKHPSLTGAIEIQVKQLWNEMELIIKLIFKI